MDRAVVVKIGGSLTDRAGAIVEEVRASGRRALIVPGGGAFADGVRALDPPATAAHWMAVCAMEAYGWYLTSFGLPATMDVAVPPGPTIFLPYTALRAADPLPHSWDVTSDTIAAWVADRLDAPLILVKSVDTLTRDGQQMHDVREAFPCEEVDPCLLPYLFDRKIPACVVNGRIPGRVSALLAWEDVPCTRIHART
jgi:aspartokinase-like uncharacterized kinase